MGRLREYVDFVTTLVNMDEVVEGVFTPPKQMVFELDEVSHRKLHKEVIKYKNIEEDDLSQPFEIQVDNVLLKFEI